MILRPARLIAALLLLGATVAHSQALNWGNESRYESSNPLDDPCHEIHLLCRSVVDGRMMGSDSSIETLSQRSEQVVKIPERITGGGFQKTLERGERTGATLPFEGLTEFLWVRNGVQNGALQTFAAAEREAEGARAIDAEKTTGSELLIWPAGGIVLAEESEFSGDDSWDAEVQRVPEPSAMILITMGCGMLLARRRVCR